MRKIIMIAGLFLLATCSGNNENSDAYGNFEAIEITMSAEAQGRLMSLNLSEGDKLEKDKVVGIVDTSDLSIQREQFMAQKRAVLSKITNIQSQMMVQMEHRNIVEIEKHRIEKLLEADAATDQQLDDIDGKLKVLDRQIESFETQKNLVRKEVDVIDQQVKLISHKISKCNIVNPINGIVLEKFIEEDELVVPGKAIYKIADLSVLNLRVFISGDQLPYIKIGQKVDVLIDKNVDENSHLEGIVIWISDQAEFTPKIIQTKEERVNLVYAAKIRVLNDGSLKIGMPGEVVFRTDD